MSAYTDARIAELEARIQAVRKVCDLARARDMDDPDNYGYEGLVNIDAVLRALDG